MSHPTPMEVSTEIAGTAENDTTTTAPATITTAIDATTTLADAPATTDIQPGIQPGIHQTHDLQNVDVSVPVPVSVSVPAPSILPAPVLPLAPPALTMASVPTAQESTIPVYQQDVDADVDVDVDIEITMTDISNANANNTAIEIEPQQEGTTTSMLTAPFVAATTTETQVAPPSTTEDHHQQHATIANTGTDINPVANQDITHGASHDQDNTHANTHANAHEADLNQENQTTNTNENGIGLGLELGAEHTSVPAPLPVSVSVAGPETVALNTDTTVTHTPLPHTPQTPHMHQNIHTHHQHHQGDQIPPTTAIPIPAINTDANVNVNLNADVNADANVDEETTPMVPQDPSFGFSYFAVRRGINGLRGSVFLNWRDCERFVDGYDDAEYASFDKFEEAVAYVSAGADQMQSDIDYSAGTSTGACASTPVAGAGVGNEDGPIGSGPAKKRKLGSYTGLEKDISFISPYGSSNNDHNSNSNNNNSTPSSGRRGVRVKAEANPNRKPTKAWEKMYQRYVQYINEKETNEVDSSKENADLLRWTRQQQHEYRYLKEGKASSMFQVKIDKLQEVGFEFKFVSMDERLTSLLQFKEKYGHYNVPETHPILGRWVDEQKKAAKKFADEGDATSFFDAKIKELMSLGFKVDVEESVNEEKDQSNNTKNDKSDETDVSRSSPVSLGNGGFASMGSVRSDDDKKWNKNFADLVEYKKKHGNCEVPPSQHTPLSYWVTQQHKEYQKVQEKKPSRLTLQKVQQLTDLGFVFRQVAKSFTWEQRIEQLKKYREKHNHTRVPKSDPQLGVFVNRQRYEYSKYKSNRPSTMNEARLKDLQALDFVFVAGKKMDHVDFKNKKSWEERFDELMHFRDTYGHAVVPQSFPGLGEWVHSQRLYYKKLKAGKKSPLTNDRLLKLADVGFVFDATKRRGNHVNEMGAPRGLLPPQPTTPTANSVIMNMAMNTGAPAQVVPPPSIPGAASVAPNITAMATAIPPAEPPATEEPATAPTVTTMSV